MQPDRTGPTRAGFLAAAAGIGTVAVGRFFGVFELYVLGTAAVALVAACWLRVVTARTSFAVHRVLHPKRVQSGGEATVQLELVARKRTTELVLHEPVQRTGGATIHLAPLARNEQVRGHYRLPTSRRGPLAVGPLTATVSDPFGLARRTTVIAPRTELLVYPRILPLAAPRIGSAGPLGTHLAQRAMATAAGAEFHSQREYVAGDDLRRVNWRASARSTELIVRETAHDGRVMVHLVLDLVPSLDDPDPDEAFERAVSAAASVAVAVAERDLPLRVELTDGTWFRGGAEVLTPLLDHLALVQTDEREVPAGGRTDHDLLGVAVLVSGGGAARAATMRARAASAAAATVVIATGGGAASGGAGWFSVDATDLAQFVEQWNALVGEHRARVLA